ncbi:MAG: DUF2461 domain-containing protein [Patescibacteria group bacterium]
MTENEILEISNFLTDLEENNTKIWMDQNRTTYLKVKEYFVKIVEKIHFELSQEVKELQLIDPKKCIYRINRDIRFSSNKQPYKTWFAAGICAQGKSSGYPSFYFHISKNSIWVGVGSWQPPNDRLKNIRHYVLDNNLETDSVLTLLKKNKISFGEEFGKLKKLPRGFEKLKVNEDVKELLLLKSFVIAKELELNSQSLNQTISLFFLEFRSIVKWLNQAEGYLNYTQ